MVRGLTDAEKKAYVFQCNMVRRNLSPAQRAEAHSAMKKVALELRRENAKKNTQERLGAMLGVARSTVEGWFRNDGGVNPKPDARVTVPRSAWSEIAKRAKKGEYQAQLAADLTRLGELMEAQRKAGLLRPGGERRHGSKKDPSPPTLAEAGIDKHLADRAHKAGGDARRRSASDSQPTVLVRPAMKVKDWSPALV